MKTRIYAAPAVKGLKRSAAFGGGGVPLGCKLEIGSACKLVTLQEQLSLGIKINKFDKNFHSREFDISLEERGKD